MRKITTEKIEVSPKKKLFRSNTICIPHTSKVTLFTVDSESDKSERKKATAPNEKQIMF